MTSRPHSPDSLKWHSTQESEQYVDPVKPIIFNESLPLRSPGKHPWCPMCLNSARLPHAWVAFTSWDKCDSVAVCRFCLERVWVWFHVMQVLIMTRFLSDFMSGYSRDSNWCIIGLIHYVVMGFFGRRTWRVFIELHRPFWFVVQDSQT